MLLYDNNQVTCDGPLSWISTEDVNAKMRATGWEVLDVWDGRYDVDAIVSALKLSKNVVGKPIFINIRTVIGVDMASAGTAKAHHGGFDPESISSSKILAGLSPTSKYIVPDRVSEYFGELKSRGSTLQSDWNKTMEDLQSRHPELAEQLSFRMKPSESASSVLSSMNAQQFQGMPTREVNGIILQKLWKELPMLCGGGADLVNSNKIMYGENDVFDETSQYKGRYIRNGIREHAMASVANGMAAYNPGTFLPITATFFMFYIYVRIFNLSRYLDTLTV